MSQMTGVWPDAELDSVRRMRILVAALPHAAFRERVLDAPFRRIWGIAGDLEQGTPQWKADVSELTIMRQAGDHLEVSIRSHLGIRLHLRAVLRSGWCLMQGRLLTVGMAASPEGERTRFAHFQAINLPASRIVAPVLRHRIHHELQTLERLAQRQGDRETTARF